MVFLSGKLVWFALSPANFLALLLAAGVLWLVVSRRRRGLSLVLVGALGFLTFLILPVGDWLLLSVSDRTDALFPGPA
jgi:hypothetical protein